MADRLNGYNTYLGDPGFINRDFERFASVGIDEVGHVARSRLVGKHKARLVVRSSARSASAILAADSNPPAASGPMEPPIPEVRTLALGIPAWILSRRNLPIAAVCVAFRSGAEALSARQGGLARLASAMIREGTRKRSAEAIAETLQGLGSTVHASTGWDGSYLNVQTLTCHFEQTLDLACELIESPAFPEREWERARGQGARWTCLRIQ